MIRSGWLIRAGRSVERSNSNSIGKNCNLGKVSLTSGASLGFDEALSDEDSCVDDAALQPLRARLGASVGRSNVFAHFFYHR